jgi:hypothetical protein
MIEKPKKYLLVIAAVTTLVIILAPAAIYVATFGWTLSSDHQRWAEMGSAMAGIYTPIMSLLTLGVLINQVYLQRQINEHQYDQGFIQEGRNDLQFILTRLDDLLRNQTVGPTSLKKHLVANFAYGFKGCSTDGPHAEQAIALDMQHPQLLSLWGGIYPIISALKGMKRYPYEHNYLVAVQKTGYVLSWEACVALDNYHACLVRREGRFEYEFSQDLGESAGL